MFCVWFEGILMCSLYIRIETLHMYFCSGTGFHTLLPRCQSTVQTQHISIQQTSIQHISIQHISIQHTSHPLPIPSTPQHTPSQRPPIPNAHTRSSAAQPPHVNRAKRLTHGSAPRSRSVSLSADTRRRIRSHTLYAASCALAATGPRALSAHATPMHGRRRSTSSQSIRFTK